MEKEQILKSLDNAVDKQVPDVWDEIHYKIQKDEKLWFGQEAVHLHPAVSSYKKKKLYVRFSFLAAACLIAFFALTFTPALASIQQVIDQIFSSSHIDDTGLKMAMKKGIGNNLDQTYYDKTNDITVHFQDVLVDDKETKLLLTFQSKTKNLEDYYIDNFEGKSSINLIVDGKRNKLESVGWGSRYYDKKTNKVVEALSFDSIKALKGKEVHLEIKDLTIYHGQGVKTVSAVWPLTFILDPSAVTDREYVAVNKEFKFDGQTYKIKRVEFSTLETRVVVTGTDTGFLTDPFDGSKYKTKSKLELQFLNARKVSKDTGYTVDYNKSGVFLLSAGQKIGPIYSKGEVKGEPDEFLMIFDPVKDRHHLTLQIGDQLQIPLTK